MKKSFWYFLVCTLLALFFSSTIHAQEDRVYLEIGSTDVRKINFAIPWFISRQVNANGNKLSRNLADTLAKSLKFHGVINIIPTADYNGSQDADWNKLGADFTVLGVYEATQNTIKLEMRLFDVANNRMILGKSYS